jgi:hypothetical protein
MSDPKRRILARRSAFIAAAFTAASCDRCITKSEPCLSVKTIEDAAEPTAIPSLQPPVVCLSMPIPFDSGVSSDASKDGSMVKLQTIDITIDAGAPPVPCLSVAPPTVCLKMPSKKEE